MARLMSEISPDRKDGDKPLRIDYRRPDPRNSGPGKTTFQRFVLGIVGGVAVSGMVYLLGWNATFNQGGIPIIVVASLKVVACIVLLFFRGWRSLGLGLLTSIPIVVLIFLGVCALIVR